MHENLASASDLVAEAGEAADNDRLVDLAEQLDSLARGERHADHGRLARIQSGLDEEQATVDDDVAVTIEEALDAIDAHRETLDGV
ncbi:MAG: hypothetical protein ABEH56_06190 [Salinirussus sp.]